MSNHVDLTLNVIREVVRQYIEREGPSGQVDPEWLAQTRSAATHKVAADPAAPQTYGTVQSGYTYWLGLQRVRDFDSLLQRWLTGENLKLVERMVQHCSDEAEIEKVKNSLNPARILPLSENIAVAFGLLAQEIEGAVSELRRASVEAFQDGRYGAATSFERHIRQMLHLKGKIEELEQNTGDF